MGTFRLASASHLRARALLVASILSLAACVDGTTLAPVEIPPPPGSVGPMPDVDLVFIGDASDGPNLFGFRHRDGELFRITGVASSYLGVNLSPTGGALAVAAVRQGCRQILAIDLDSRVEQAVSDPIADGCVYSPRWSPDASSIVYSNLRGGYHLVMVNADGSDRRVLVPPAGLSVYITPHGWDPDGRVVFHRGESNGAWGAYVVNADGTGVEPLFGRGSDITPEWSPSGSRVAFVREVDGLRSLWVADADGANAIQISDSESPARLAFVTAAGDWVKDHWSPDGEWLAMTRDSAFLLAVDVVRADGSERRRIADFGAQTLFMGWTKEGRVSFQASSGGTRHLYTSWPDGSGLQEVVLPIQFVGNAIWRRAFVDMPR